MLIWPAVASKPDLVAPLIYELLTGTLKSVLPKGFYSHTVKPKVHTVTVCQ